MGPSSLRWRLTLWYTLVLALSLLLLETALYLAYRNSLVQGCDSRLSAAATAVAQGLRHPTEPGEGGGLEEALEPVIGGNQSGGPAVVIFSRDGRRLAATGGAEPITFFRVALQTRRFEGVGQGEYRLLALPAGAYIVEAALPWGPLEESLRPVRWLLAAVLALCVGAAGAGGWALVAAALRPIDRVVAAASRISEQSLSERLPAAASARELHTLVEVLNGMIERLAAAVETQKRFTADASHELRTPVTVVQNEVEVALVKPRSPREYQAVLRSVLEECQRMSRLVADLLMLARADSLPRPLRPVEVPLDDLCRLVVEEFQPRAQARGIGLTVATPVSGPAVLGDPNSLRRLLENLVENAVNHTPAGGRVGVRLTGQDGQAVLSVWDTGPGIPPEHLPHLFERFYRVEPGRGAGGTGLGLAICDQIARQHGGSLRVESSDRQGTELIASLPYLSASHGDPP